MGRVAHRPVTLRDSTCLGQGSAHHPCRSLWVSMTVKQTLGSTSQTPGVFKGVIWQGSDTRHPERKTNHCVPWVPALASGVGWQALGVRPHDTDV